MSRLIFYMGQVRLLSIVVGVNDKIFLYFPLCI